MFIFLIFAQKRHLFCRGLRRSGHLIKVVKCKTHWIKSVNFTLIFFYTFYPLQVLHFTLFANSLWLMLYAGPSSNIEVKWLFAGRYCTCISCIKNCCWVEFIILLPSYDPLEAWCLLCCAHRCAHYCNIHQDFGTYLPSPTFFWFVLFVYLFVCLFILLLKLLFE